MIKLNLTKEQVDNNGRKMTDEQWWGDLQKDWLTMHEHIERLESNQLILLQKFNDKQIEIARLNKAYEGAVEEMDNRSTFRYPLIILRRHFGIDKE